MVEPAPNSGWGGGNSWCQNKKHKQQGAVGDPTRFVFVVVLKTDCLQCLARGAKQPNWGTSWSCRLLVRGGKEARHPRPMGNASYPTTATFQFLYCFSGSCTVVRKRLRFTLPPVRVCGQVDTAMFWKEHVAFAPCPRIKRRGSAGYLAWHGRVSTWGPRDVRDRATQGAHVIFSGSDRFVRGAHASWMHKPSTKLNPRGAVHHDRVKFGPRT